MTENELKKLNRRELLELLILQTKRTEELEEKLAEAEHQLADKRISAKNAGSIAEAALQINGVFEAAQAAAQQYLDNIESCSARCDRMLAETKKRCALMERKAALKVEMLKAEVDKIKNEWNNTSMK